MTKIPMEELETARRMLCRRLAASLAIAMAETDIGLAEIDARCRLTAGTSQNWLLRLLDGDSIDLDAISDVFLACGCLLKFSLVRGQPEVTGEPIHFPASDDGE